MRVAIFLMFLLAGFSVVDSMAFDARYSTALLMSAHAEGQAFAQVVGSWVTAPLNSNSEK